MNEVDDRDWRAELLDEYISSLGIVLAVFFGVAMLIKLIAEIAQHGL